MWYIGIDAGGTNTRAIVADETGIVHSIGRSGSANWNTLGLEEANSALLASIEDAFKKINVTYNNNIQSVYIGSASLEQKLSVQESKGIFSIENIPHVIFDTDAYTALVGAFGKPFGALIIAGTGSMAIAVLENTRFVAGGWGAYYGDKGSAYYIGKQGIEIALANFDSCNIHEHTNIILELLLQYANIPATDNKLSIRKKLISLLYQDNHIKWVAGFSQKLAEYTADDNSIYGLFYNAGQDLGMYMENVLNQMSITQKQKIPYFPVTYSGSVLNNNKIVKESFTSYITSLQLPITITQPQLPQSIGALLLSFYETNNYNLSIMENIKSSLSKFDTRLFS